MHKAKKNLTHSWLKKIGNTTLVSITSLALIIPSISLADGAEESSFEGNVGISNELLEARKKLAESAEAKRQALLNQSFEEFQESVYKEPGENGKYIVNGDTPIANAKQLREYFAQIKRNATAKVDPTKPELAVNTAGGLDTIWSKSEKKALTYCISTAFGTQYQVTIEAMKNAAAAWEAAGDLQFVHLSAHDDNCTASNDNVMFDVRPVSGGHYLARAFFPNDNRPARNILIDSSSYTLDPNRNLTLTGILRHELGHVIGIRHEHTRPDSGTCFEDQNWRPVTDYDAFSVMHYPQCNGAGDWSLTLTHFDKNGIACLYGPAEGFTIDNTICQPASSVSGNVKTLVFENVHIEKGKEWEPETLPFDVVGGSGFSAIMTGSGDPDLYVKFDAPANRADYDCRPYASSAQEECVVDVPSNASRAYIMVRGYEAGTFNLTIKYITP